MKEDDDDIQDYVSSKSKTFDPDYNYEREIRNRTLEEVAKEFDKMPFGDTSASFAIFVRNMKR